MVNSLYKASEESNAALWRDVAKRLEKPRRSWAEVGLERLGRVTKKGDIVLVPGKLLATGNITHAVNIYSYNASKTAVERVQNAGGKVLPLEDALKLKPKELRIIK